MRDKRISELKKQLKSLDSGSGVLRSKKEEEEQPPAGKIMFPSVANPNDL
jgi:hypothetical protein